LPVKDFLKNGDFASARLLLRQAAEAGSADATLMFGETFDPLVIKSVLSSFSPLTWHDNVLSPALLLNPLEFS
jgi:hypothetical protein